MAVTGPTFANVPGEAGRDGITATWVFTGAGPSNGAPIGSPFAGAGAGASGLGFLAGYADKTFQVTGTFGASPVMTIQGSNDGINWFTLTTPSGNTSGTLGVAGPATFVAALIEQITEACVQYRPSFTGGDGTTNLTVVAFCRKTQTP